MRLIDRGKKGRGLRLAVSVSAVRRELIEMFAGAIIDLYNVCSECHEIANYFPLKKKKIMCQMIQRSCGMIENGLRSKMSNKYRIIYRKQLLMLIRKY